MGVIYKSLSFKGKTYTALPFDSNPPDWWGNSNLGIYSIDTAVKYKLPANHARSFTIRSGSLPAGLTLEKNSGTILGTTENNSETFTHTSTFTIQATNPFGFATKTFTMTVKNPNTENSSNWLTPSNLGDYSGGTNIDILIEFKADYNTASLYSGTLPLQTTFTPNQNNTNFHILGTLDTVSTPTTYIFTIRVTDGSPDTQWFPNGHDDGTFSITITP